MEEDAITFYVDLMKDDGPPGATSNGFNENLALFDAGNCAHVDRRHGRRAGFVTNPKESKVADKVGFALAPNRRSRQGRQLAVGLDARRSPPARRRPTPREKFIAWATSKDYTKLVA